MRDKGTRPWWRERSSALPSLLGCLLLVAGGEPAVAGSAAAPLAECPDVIAADEVEAGTRARGWTVARGDVPEPFQVEVLGVLRDGIAPGRDMIIVEVEDEPGSEFIARAGGIWAGMSGSPVYVGARLLGAVAWGFSAGPSRVGGVTPAEDMLEVLSLPAQTRTVAARASVPTPASLRGLLAERSGLGSSQVEAFEPLPIPFAVSGLNSRGRRLVREGLERVGISALVTPTSSGDRPRGVLSARPVAGGNFAGMVSLGDVTSGGVGTTTYVCGDRVLAFGHPLGRLGSVALSANTAEAITIVTDPTFTPFKLANVGATVGVLDQDRGVAVGATLGKRPRLVPVRSVVLAPGLGRRREGVSWTTTSRFVPSTAALHLLSNLDAVFDEVGDGSSWVRWRVAGRRADGDRWRLKRSNVYASESDITFSSVFEMFDQLAAIESNPLEEVRFKRVRLRARVETEPAAYRVDSFTVMNAAEPSASPGDSVFRPGDEIVVRVELQGVGVQRASADLRLTVPLQARGSGTVFVLGGNVIFGFEAEPDCLFDPAACGGEGTDDSFEAFLDSLEGRPKNNELRAVLQFFDGANVEVQVGRRLDRVVSGFADGFITVAAETTTTTTTPRIVSTTTVSSSSTTLRRPRHEAGPDAAR